MKKRPKFGIIIILILTVALSAAAIWVGIRLGNQNKVDPDDSQAASEQVTNADKLKTQEQRDAFNDRWKAFIADTSNTWEDYVEFAISEDGSRYECDTVIMDKVGEETIYGCDLNVLFALYELNMYMSSEAIGPQNETLNKVLDTLITQSGMLQVAEDEDLLTLDATIFNSTSKDYIARINKVGDVKVVLGDRFIKRIDFKGIIIYFHNEQPPTEISLDEAKKAAKTKIDTLYARLKAKEITMEQAGSEIMADKIIGDTSGISMEKLDPVYKDNAYFEIVGHEFNYPLLVEGQFDSELKSLGEGQISTVLTLKDYVIPESTVDSGDFGGLQMVDSAYVIVEAGKIYFGVENNYEAGSQEELEEKVQSDYKKDVEYIIK